MSPLPRCGLVLVAVSATAGGVGTWLLPVAARTGGGLDDRLTAVCAAAGLLAAAWLWLVTVSVVVEAARAAEGRGASSRVDAAPGGVSRLLAPSVVRRAVLAACGAATLAGLTASAGHAGVAVDPGAADGSGGHGPGPTVASVVARALQQGDRPDARGGRRAGAVVTVRPGDCLWDIAGADLARRPGPRAARVDDAEIDRHWREIYAANRSVIGPDPDLIRPAERLWLPR